MTLEQRRVMLERIRREVEGVVEDIQATAASLGAVSTRESELSLTERATLRLIVDEQWRQQLELTRLYGEYNSLTFRRSARAARLLSPSGAEG